MADQLITHPGELCESGARAVRLALECARAWRRVAELEELLAAAEGRTPGVVMGADPPLEVWPRPADEAVVPGFRPAGARQSDYTWRA